MLTAAFQTTVRSYTVRRTQYGYYSNS